jgi:hypothetical protein
VGSVDEVLLSPEGENWYHGSPRQWTRFDLEAPKTAGSWSSYLGVHFAATRDTAVRFGNGDLYGELDAPGQVVRARLRSRNPYRFEDEVGMDLHALWVCLGRNLLDEMAILERWGADKEDALDLFLDALVALPDHKQAEALVAMMPPGLDPLDLIYCGDLQATYVATTVRADLQARGHDGVTYLNWLESEGDPDTCAVVWDQDKIEVLEIETLISEEEVS